MRDFDEHSITQAVIDAVANTPSPRLKQVTEAFVRHFHDFVREVEPTYDEWMTGIEFLTRTGQMCSGNRQEFILLSDTLGVSMLVDAINHRFPEGATESTVMGPFYVEDPPEFPLGADISNGVIGEPLLVQGTVRTVDGVPLARATVDTWQSDSEGYYDVQHGDQLALRGRLRTDVDGRFWFWAIVPSSYPIPNDGPVGEMVRAQGRHPYRPAHVHFKISAGGFVELVTHVFVAGDQYLDSDAVFGVKTSLIHELERRPAGTAPDGRVMDRPYAIMRYDFALTLSPAVAAHWAHSRSRTESARARFEHERVSYGDHPRQVMDVWSPPQPTGGGDPGGRGAAPVLVFLHGGGFRVGEPANDAYVGVPVLEQGGIFVSMGYRLVPDARFPESCEDVDLGLRWLRDHVAERGGDPARIYISGHSAGAMLAAMAALRPGGEPPVAGAVLVSGMYDFTPQPAEIVDTASPRYVPTLAEAIEYVPGHTVVVAGDSDLPRCVPDARALVEAIRGRGGSVELFIEPEANHFQAIYGMASADGAVARATLRMMGLVPVEAISGT
jgi:hydroxyquinol 1,2-dioxygenase